MPNTRRIHQPGPLTQQEIDAIMGISPLIIEVKNGMKMYRPRGKSYQWKDGYWLSVLQDGAETVNDVFRSFHTTKKGLLKQVNRLFD